MSADPVDQISRICDDADGDKLTRIAAVIGEAPAPTSGNDDYVAWARYVRVDDDPTRIVLCNSDVKGAFKVYRHPPTMPTSGNDEVEAMCHRLNCIVVDSRADNKTCLDGIALLRKQAAQIAHLEAVNEGYLIGRETLGAQIAELQKERAEILRKSAA